MSSETCKVVAVGDGAVGKTCLLMVYVNNEFPEDYVPTVFENYDTKLKYKDRSINLSLWDTAGQEEFDKLRYLSYPNANCFLICFAVDQKASYKNVKDKWIPELEKYSKGVPYILVATKVDMRNEGSGDFVSKEDGEKLAKEIGAASYIETSARQNVGVKEMFDTTVEIKLNGKQSSGGAAGGGGGCCIIS